LLTTIEEFEGGAMRQPRPTCEQRVGTEGAERSGKKRVKRRPTRQRAWSRDGVEIDEEEARVRKNSRGSHHWGPFFILVRWLVTLQR
jgi:hypothetical protein